ncbi:hypothetical protein GCM10010372_56310 [Streptomyces tauricus]|nr:hypothetical protein GCM10010372_56310 [Streptomyces tauricus]
MARSTSADTDASKEEAAAEADDAAAEAAARADSTTDSFMEGAVPEKDAVSGGDGRSLKEGVEVSEPLSVLHDVTALATAARAATATTVERVRPGRRGPRGLWGGGVFIGCCPRCRCLGGRRGRPGRNEPYVGKSAQACRAGP